MKCTKTTLLYNNTEHILIHSVFPFTNIHIITVKGFGILQVVLNRDKHIVSYTKGIIDAETLILQEYLRRIETGKGTVDILHKESVEYDISESELHLQTVKHRFVVNIKEEPTHYSVKSGGKEFVGCVEIMIDKVSDRMQLPTIAQIYSEPECWYNSLHSNRDIVDLIKGTLQLCQLLFGTSKFMFSDKSAIECGKTNNSGPPRKRKQALSLAPLSFIKYCKTWYQYNFNAYIDPSEPIDAFKDGLEKLKTYVDISFDTFIRKYRLNSEQISFLQPLYNDCYHKRSWLAFFHAIPSKYHCSIFFNWLPTFIDEHIMNNQFYLNRVTWIIDLGEVGHLVKENEIQKPKKPNEIPETIVEPTIVCEYPPPTTMVRTDLYLLTVLNDMRSWSGGYKPTKRHNTRKSVKQYNTRRQDKDWKVLSLSNDILPTHR